MEFGLYHYRCECPVCGKDAWSDKGMLRPERAYKRHWWREHENQNWSRRPYCDEKCVAAPGTPAGESEWRRVDANTPQGELILFFPAVPGRNSNPKMTKIGQISNSPFRRPTHWMPVPADPPAEPSDG